MDKQPVITQKTLVVENNGNVDMVVFVAPHEEWKFLDEAGEYGRKVGFRFVFEYAVYFRSISCRGRSSRFTRSSLLLQI